MNSNKHKRIYIYDFLFVAVILVLFFTYDQHEILFLRPQSVHQWRQCDCLSQALNYYQDKNSFWQPQMNYLGTDNTGKTASDFPLLYYSAAKFWSVFGYKEYIYRLLVLIISFCGLFSLYRISKIILKDGFWALFPPTLLYSSTIFVYYSNNFLTNIPAFSFALCALYAFAMFVTTKKRIYWYLTLILYTISGLLKITGLTGFAAIIVYFVLEVFKIIKVKNKIFDKKIEYIIGFIAVIAIVTSWYFYASFYNKHHNEGIFLIGILPIWEHSWQRIKHIIDLAWILWSNSYHSRITQLISIIILIFLLINHKKWNLKLKIFTSTLVAGFVLYVILWFNVFDNHDYYLINQLLLLIFVYISFMRYLSDNHSKIFDSYWLKVIAVIFLVYNVSVCQKNIHLRYHGWPNAKHVKYYKSLENIDSYLTETGISRKDTVIVFGDKSFNIALYLMNRKGYTSCFDNFGDSVSIANKIKSGVKYLMVIDSSYLQKSYLQPFLTRKISNYQNLNIFYVGSSSDSLDIRTD